VSRLHFSILIFCACIVTIGSTSAASITIEDEFSTRGIFAPQVVVQAGKNNRALITTLDTGDVTDLGLRLATGTLLGIEDGKPTSARVGPLSAVKQTQKPREANAIIKNADKNVNQQKLSPAVDLFPTVGDGITFDAIGIEYLIKNRLVAVTDPSRPKRQKIEKFGNNPNSSGQFGIVSNDVRFLPPNKTPNSTIKLPIKIDKSRPFTENTKFTEGNASSSSSVLWDTGFPDNRISVDAAKKLGFNPDAIKPDPQGRKTVIIDTVEVAGTGNDKLVLKVVPFTIDDKPTTDFIIGETVIERFGTVLNFVDKNPFIGLSQIKRPVIIERGAQGKSVTLEWKFQNETVLKQEKVIGPTGLTSFSGPWGYTDFRQKTTGSGTADLFVGAINTADSGEFFLTPLIDFIFDLDPLRSSFSIPDLFPAGDLTGDGIITEDDIIFSAIVNLEEFLSAQEVDLILDSPFNVEFFIENGILQIPFNNGFYPLPGIQFSRQEFTFDPINGITAPESSLFTGMALFDATHTVVLQPVSEPPIFGLLGIGLAALCFMRRSSMSF